MELRRTTGRLGERLALGALLITLALVLWVAGTVGAAAVSCPDQTARSIDSAISAWPPGKQCASAVGADTVEPLFPGIEWGVIGLALLGAVLLLLGVVAEIRRLRQPPARLPRPWTSPSPTSRRTSSPRSVTSAAARSAHPSSASG